MLEPRLGSELHNYRTQNVHWQLLFKHNLSFLQKWLSHRTIGGKLWGSCLRHCATSCKVVGSIADGVTGNFHCHIPSERTMYLGSNLPLTELSTRNISIGEEAASA